MFAGNTLDRSSGDRKSPGFCSQVIHEKDSRFLIVSQGHVVTVEDEEQCASLMWYDLETVRSKWKALRNIDPSSASEPSDEEGLVLLLGSHGDSRWSLAVMIDAVDVDAAKCLGEGEALLSGRDIVSRSNPKVPETCAIAGQALALAKWHQSNRFCSFSGRCNVPIEAGAKRATAPAAAEQATKRTRTYRHYPRTDPVSIMLVVSPCGTKALLGRGRKHREGMYTCLAGFIEQCESVEEAVVRETWEEAGVKLDIRSVTLFKSQPWPIGRAGKCELMIGCFASAAPSEADADGCPAIRVNTTELADARWFSRQQVQPMLQRSIELSHITRQAKGGDDGVKAAIAAAQKEWAAQAQGAEILVTPGPYAIAHTLIRTWCERPELVSSFLQSNTEHNAEYPADSAVVDSSAQPPKRQKT